MANERVGAPLPAPVLEALERGQKIEAIKLLREATGLGLKESKDAVEAHLASDAALRGRFDDSTATRNASGSGWLLAVGLALLGLGAYVLSRLGG